MANSVTRVQTSATQATQATQAIQAAPVWMNLKEAATAMGISPTKIGLLIAGRAGTQIGDRTIHLKTRTVGVRSIRTTQEWIDEYQAECEKARIAHESGRTHASTPTSPKRKGARAARKHLHSAGAL